PIPAMRLTALCTPPAAVTATSAARDITTAPAKPLRAVPPTTALPAPASTMPAEPLPVANTGAVPAAAARPTTTERRLGPPARAGGEACTPADSMAAASVASVSGTEMEECMSVQAWRKDRRLHFRLMFTPLLALTLVVALVSCSKRETKATQNAAEPAAGNLVQKTFASPAAAGAALFDANKKGDTNALMAIFGSAGKDVVFSGDTVKDKNNMQRFVDAYSRMNRWGKTKSGEEILYIGA